MEPCYKEGNEAVSPELSIDAVRSIRVVSHEGTHAAGWVEITCRDASGKALFEITVWGERGDKTPPLLEVK